MLGKIPSPQSLDLFKTPLVNFINRGHELCMLADQVAWSGIESELGHYYSEAGRPSVPIRKIGGLLILKRMFNESDESVVDRWIENPYWQYFTGEVYFQNSQPFDPSDFVHFRHRIGQAGMEVLLKHSLHIHGIGKEIENPKKRKKIKTIAIDPTVQPKNITYPTDTKLQVKIIKRCWKIAKKLGIKWRQSYRFKLKKWLLAQRNKHHPKRQKEARRTARLIHNTAARLVKELSKKMDDYSRQTYQEELQLFEKVLNQQRGDKNKIYSLHEVEVHCINKGKAFPKYEFGTKASVAWDIDKGLIIGVVDGRNAYDGKLLEPTLNQIKSVLGYQPSEALVDRGCKGKAWIGETKIIRPGRAKASATKYQKSKARKKMRRRAGVEPIISHLKYDHRMWKCYLKGVAGDGINMVLAAVGFNFRKKLLELKKYFFFILNVQHVINYSGIHIRQIDKRKVQPILFFENQHL